MTTNVKYESFRMQQIYELKKIASTSKKQDVNVEIL